MSYNNTYDWLIYGLSFKNRTYDWLVDWLIYGLSPTTEHMIGWSGLVDKWFDLILQSFLTVKFRMLEVSFSKFMNCAV